MQLVIERPELYMRAVFRERERERVVPRRIEDRGVGAGVLCVK